MNLRDLLSDLDEYDEGRESEMAPRYPAERVARRVASLYQNCSVCGGSGWVDWPPPYPISGRSGCPRCDGMGVTPSDKWPDWRGNGPTIDPSTLYRFLFGDKR